MGLGGDIFALLFPTLTLVLLWGACGGLRGGMGRRSSTRSALLLASAVAPDAGGAPAAGASELFAANLVAAVAEALAGAEELSNKILERDLKPRLQDWCHARLRLRRSWARLRSRHRTRSDLGVVIQLGSGGSSGGKSRSSKNCSRRACLTLMAALLQVWV